MPDLGNAAVFSQTDASNNTGTNPGWPEGMAPSRVNDAARALQGAVKRDWDYTHYTVTSAGTAAAQTLTYSVAPELNTNQMFGFIAGFAPTGATTLNINALGAKTIKKLVAGVATDTASGDWAANDQILVRYDGTNMVIVGVNTSNVALLNSANTFTVNQTLSNTYPVWTTKNTTAPGTAFGNIGLYDFQGFNSASALKDFASINGQSQVVTAGSESGRLVFSTAIAGTNTANWSMGPGLTSVGVTGGDKGAGTINATGYYLNGVALSSGATKHTTVLTAGTTWTTNANHKWVTVTVIGGGGGGGSNSGLGGGGSGGIAIKTYTNLTPNTAYTISIGAAGAAQGTGGNTTFTDGTTLITGSGGAGTSTAVGGLGGTATNGDVNISGQSGGFGTGTFGGAGGSTMFGAGGRSPSGAGGNAAVGYGGGGSGAGSATSGGAGFTGAIIIEEWY